MRGAAALTLAVGLASASASWAQAPNCSALLDKGYLCAVPITTPGQPIGELAKLGAGAQNASTVGFTPITSNLNVGDQFNVGSDGTTFITAGPECQSRQLPANVTVTVTEIDGCAAVKVENNPTIAGDNNGAAMGLGLALVGAGGVAGVVLLNN